MGLVWEPQKRSHLKLQYDGPLQYIYIYNIDIWIIYLYLYVCLSVHMHAMDVETDQYVECKTWYVESPIMGKVSVIKLGVLYHIAILKDIQHWLVVYFTTPPVRFAPQWACTPCTLCRQLGIWRFRARGATAARHDASKRLVVDIPLQCKKESKGFHRA